MSGVEVPGRMSEIQNVSIDGRDIGADWLRAWPFGPVHFSENWLARLDGRFETVCGKAPLYWPEIYWPDAPVCPTCKAWVEAHGAHAHMAYAAAS